MADSGKQVVLDLEVQPPEVPGQTTASRSEVNRGRELVPDPVALHALVFFGYLGEALSVEGGARVDFARAVVVDRGAQVRRGDIHVR